MSENSCRAGNERHSVQATQFVRAGTRSDLQSYKTSIKLQKKKQNSFSDPTLAKVSSGSSNVSLFLRSDFICSTTRLKCSLACMHSFVCKDVTTSCTLVQASYLNDFVCPFSRNTLRTFAMGGTHISPSENAEGGNRGAPLTQTLSANRTRDGLDRSCAFFEADMKVDFRAPLFVTGWQTSSVTVVAQARTSDMTCSLGAIFTSSPLTKRIWSPRKECVWRNRFGWFFVSTW